MKQRGAPSDRSQHAGNKEQGSIIVYSAHQLTPQRNKITILISTTHLFEEKQFQHMLVLKYWEITK